MTTEQEGAPSASAGGAPAPRIDFPRLAASGAELGRQVAQMFIDAGIFTADSWGPQPSQPDPRDIRALVAERDQLRRDCECNREQAETWQARYNQLIGAALAVQQHLQRAHGQPETAVTSEYMGPDFSRSMVDGLRIDKETAGTERDEAREQAGAANADMLNALASRNRFVAQAAELVAERDRLRVELERPPLEFYGRLVARIRQALREEHDLVDCTAGVLKAELGRLVDVLEVEVAQHDQTKAERDRLRQELELVGEQHAAGLVTLRTDFTAAVNGLLPKLAEPNRQGCPCKSQCDYLDGEDRCSDSCNCAAGRRWVAGDAEPEIGVTVGRTSVADYYQSWTRMPNGSWHPNHACRHEHADQCSGLVFAEWKQLPRPLVEVVDTDGD